MTRTLGLPQELRLVPQGMSVIVNAPSVFRYTADACPERHLEAATWLGADTHGATAPDAGEIVARRLIELMRMCAIPNGVGGVGYNEGDLATLTAGAWAQQRLIRNAPKAVSEEQLCGLFRKAMGYW